MNYVLQKNSELSEILSLRCSYKTELDLQLAIQSVGLGSKGSSQNQFLNYDSNLASPNVEEVVFKFIDEIDFASLHLILNHPVLKTLMKPDILLAHYHIPVSKHVFKTLERSLEWTDLVLNWLTQKKIKPHELSFLNLITAEEQKKLLEYAAVSLLSKTESLKVLETASELILMKIDIWDIIKRPWTEAVFLELKDLRYPMSFSFNPFNQAQLRWPKSVSTQTKRNQDKMGIQIQFFVSHPDELTQMLTQLEKTAREWSTKLEGSIS